MQRARFLSYLTHERRFSDHTVTAYALELERFENFLEFEKTAIDQVDYRVLRYYISLQKESGRASTSVNRTISVLKSFFKYMLREELVSQNPATALKSLRTPKKLPVTVEKERLVALLEQQTGDAQTFVEKRDLLVMELLFGTGIRLSELLAITDSDIDGYARQIRVLGKRNKERLVPVHDLLFQQITNYQAEKKNAFSQNMSPHLIVTNRGKPAYASMIYQIVKKYLTLITSQSKRSPHVLRHSFATSLLDNGADLNAIKEILGHAGLVATQVYTHNSAERLKLIYKQAHPKA
ncbi:tyrosine-type recombinase/integrase [Sphingobacterium sp. lm-10]|uniref:tyrosine-type recombinase/integrase n=1 Tax=Sphingobacterium sp. lm-10 TaxID=2944904 RepID=UPI0020227E6A|nr:tyrosine-type recombinase/integrase [Sphingobacterium sp. lm-10]MCL7987509.1 tyrosine-type recombinase/integrase [Sphingobacterium sp. lm-10]